MRPSFRNLCMFFRMKSFALGTLQPYELPTAWDGPSATTKKKKKDKTLDVTSAKAASVLRAGIKQGKKGKKLNPSTASNASNISNASNASGGSKGPNAYLDLTGKVSRD